MALVERLKEVATGAGLESSKPRAPSRPTSGRRRGLVGKVDAIYVPTDNTVVSALEAVVRSPRRTNTVFAGDTDSVPRGAIATIGFNYYDVGVETGKVVARVLKGEKPGDIDVGYASGTDLVVNRAAAKGWACRSRAARGRRGRKMAVMGGPAARDAREHHRTGRGGRARARLRLRRPRRLPRLPHPRLSRSHRRRLVSTRRGRRGGRHHGGINPWLATVSRRAPARAPGW